ncbi:serum deprivation-response protein-like [Notothenia coriiceps]|uniref:Serum deprivation-response protein-like n=1 Tax=Notothenia coriiceps TaxID=8208 RepID=A0A6I9Q3C0_9TELE|nr:PREDICTED: serum deprivation-response protein-like [Notothenia coriiceps]
MVEGAESEDHEIPTSVFVKDSLRTPQPSQYDADSILPAPSVTGSIDGSRANDEGLLTISLSSDDDDLTIHHEEDEMFEGDAAMGLGPSSPYERRSDKFKRNSLKKVDSLKKVFSRQSIEKKMTQITTRIVPPEQREKIKKSFTTNHPKSPTAKVSSFKVSPMTFNVKKVRDGAVPTQELGSTEEKVHVEIPALGSMDGEFVLSEEHIREGVVEQIHEMLGSTSSIKAQLAINGEAPSFECEINGDHVAGLAVAEVDDGEDGEEEEEEKQKNPVEKAEETQIPTATVAVEQVA